MQKEVSGNPRFRGFSILLLATGIALCMGLSAGFMGYTAVVSGRAKILEELGGVNETIQENAEQFSLVPYAEDPDEFRDSIDQWRGYLREVCNMANNAIIDPLEEHKVLPLIGNATIYAIFLMLPLSLSANMWAAVPLAFLLPPVLAGAAAAAKPLVGMAWVNQGLMRVVGDLRVGAMEKLLEGSNRNDDFLQAMLLATGHLTNIDEAPVWLCVQLPPPLNLRVPAPRAAFHGGAWTEGCVSVTWQVLTWLSAALGLLLLLAVFRIAQALRTISDAPPAPKSPRVRFQGH